MSFTYATSVLRFLLCFFLHSIKVAVPVKIAPRVRWSTLRRKISSMRFAVEKCCKRNRRKKAELPPELHQGNNHFCHDFLWLSIFTRHPSMDLLGSFFSQSLLFLLLLVFSASGRSRDSKNKSLESTQKCFDDIDTKQLEKLRVWYNWRIVVSILFTPSSSSKGHSFDLDVSNDPRLFPHCPPA